MYGYVYVSHQFSSVQSLSRVWLFATPWAAACQASLANTNSRSLPKLMSIESVMPSNHLTLCCPLLLLPSIFLSIRVFSNKSALRIRWPKYWSFSFNIPSETLKKRTYFPLGKKIFIKNNRNSKPGNKINNHVKQYSEFWKLGLQCAVVKRIK